MLLEFVGKVAKLLESWPDARRMTFLVPRTSAHARYAECFSVLGAAWRSYDCGTRLHLERGCRVLDADGVARVEGRKRSLWDFDTPHASVWRCLRRSLATLGDDAPDRARRAGILVARTGARTVDDNDRLFAALKGHAPHLRWVTFDGRGSLAAQAALFRSASVVVAPHGAALANVVFSRPNTAVLELPIRGHANKVYKSQDTAPPFWTRAAERGG